jgi:hypothetical protein
MKAGVGCENRINRRIYFDAPLQHILTLLSQEFSNDKIKLVVHYTYSARMFASLTGSTANSSAGEL